MTTDREDGSWQNSSDNAYGWSGPSTHGGCDGSLHYIHGLNAGWTDGGCSASVNGTVPATYEGYWAHSIFYGAFNAREPLTYQSSCSGDGSPVPWNDFSFKAWCDVPGADPAAAQAVVVTCTESSTTSNPGESGTSTETYTIRMRRTECDRTVDSDGDDLADCTEFSLKTETHNPDTDGDDLTDGEEVLTYGTDPLNPDTDGGGVPDGDEVALGTDPLNPVDDFANCRFMNTSFIGGWEGDFDIEQPVGADPLHWMRYSWNDVRYCVDGAGVRLASTGSQEGAVVLPEDVAYFFELLDFKMKYAGSDSVRVERLADDSLEAKVKGRFKFCSGIPLFGTVVGKGIKAVLKIVPARFEKKLLEWGRRRIFKSRLIPTWIKNEIVERGFKAVLKSFGALSDTDYKAIMRLFRWIGNKVGGNLARLVLGDLLCKTVWGPEIVARFMPDGAYDTFAQGPTGPFEVMKDF